MRESSARVVVLDDDPTGSQTARDVRVVTRPTREALASWATSGERSLYVVTNTRSMTERSAVHLVRRLVADVRDLAGTAATFVLRGDSTLRGHVMAEIDALGGRDGVSVFLPAYPEAGRVTRDGTHYVRAEGSLLPVADTEFAKDPVFGYEESHLPTWLSERASGRVVRPVSLDVVRSGPDRITQLLRAAAAGTIFVPDAETVADVDVVVAACATADAAGCSVILRTAATGAALRAGVYADKPIQARPVQEPILVVCGSHTSASTRQLEALYRYVACDPVVMDPYPATTFAADVATAVGRVAAALRRDGIAVLTSARHRPLELGTLADGASMMRRLSQVVSSVSSEVGACVAKGGITSADVAVALGATDARVLGHIEAGVSLWRLNRPTPTQYIVVPGNVGDDETLVRCVHALVADGSRALAGTRR